MKNWIEYQLLKIRYKELLAKSERQRKQLDMLEQSRSEIRKHNTNLYRTLKKLYVPTKIAVNQIICICEKDSDNLCQPCENREDLAMALESVEKLITWQESEKLIKS